MKKKLLKTLVCVLVLTGFISGSANALNIYSNLGIAAYSSGVVKSTSITVPPGFCMGYGHFHIASTDFNAGGIIPTDLATFKAAGINCIRLAVNTIGGATSTTNFDMQLATTSVAAGFYTCYGMTLGGQSVIGSSTVDVYMKAWVNQLAPLFIQYNIPCLIMGNEEEYHLNQADISTTTFQNDMKTLASQIKALGYTGDVDYVTEIGMESAWAALGRGSIDNLGFNVYGNYAWQLSKALAIVSDFGTHGFVGEWNLDGNANTGGLPDFGGNDAQYATELQQEARALRESGISKYYLFTYRTNNTYQAGIFNGMSLQTDAGPKSMELQILGL